MQKTLDEWIKIYEQKTGEKFKRDKGFEIYYLPEKGFCVLGVRENKFTVGAVCGDGKFWRDFSEEVARKCGFKFGVTLFIRKSIKAYIRLLGYKVVKEIENEIGTKDYLCVDSDGKKATVTLNSEGEKNIYRVYWEV